jgi:hypothetical protein
MQDESNSTTEIPQLSSATVASSMYSVLDVLMRQVSDLESRIRRIESHEKPLNSYLRASRRLSNITSFVLIIAPTFLTIAIVLCYIIFNPSQTISTIIISIFGFVGLIALVEFIIIPIAINNINNKLNKIIEKHYPSEDL